VELHGLIGNSEALGDSLVWQPLCHQFQDLDFARRERLDEGPIVFVVRCLGRRDQDRVRRQP
jgi:hypothetical protein